MSWILIAVVIVFVIAALVAIAGKKTDSGSAIGYPYVPAKALFSAAERSFLGVLDQSVGSEHRVFGKVRVADIAAVKPGLSRSARQGAVNRIGSKHFDFVVCRASDFSVVCAIELNDKSHASKRAQERDAVKRNVCRSIGLPLFEVPAKRAYSVSELQGQLASVIGVAPAVAAVAT
ncbi:DUF2726 domain-containing protein [Nitrosococcus oceani]|uniref:DUF2726 domain-containing protein n=1 Tax=Nitrosococcus oceani TaxID=1229 RepID=UPI00068D3593|nr:DUF2726 domain-containing protein [Nitrosococcus oceani]